MMNPSYNYGSAAERLEILAQERSTENLAGIQLANWGGDGALDIIQVVDDGLDSTKRLTWRKDAVSGGEDGQIEDSEIVWHIQGVMTFVELPPFVPKGKYKDKVKFLRQGVRLSGLETPSFDGAFQSIKDISAMFSRSVAKIQPPTFLGEDDRGLYLDTSNRYFSSTRDGRGGIQKAFAPDVDPTGALASLGGSSYYHGEENSVMYLERRYSRINGKKYASPVSPVTFKAGDIVEVQVTFMLVPLKGDEWKLVATLRCVILLDRKFTQDCMRDSLAFGPRPGVNRRSSQTMKVLKRRAGYDLDEEEIDVIPISKMAKMDLDADEEE